MKLENEGQIVVSCAAMLRPNSMLILSISALLTTAAMASPELEERLARQHEAFLKDRRAALPKLSDPFGAPPAALLLPPWRWQFFALLSSLCFFHVW